MPIIAADHCARKWVGTIVDVNARRVATERTTRLQEVTTALADALTLDQVGTAVVDQALAATGAVAASIRLVTADGQRLEPLRSVGYPANADRSWGHIALAARRCRAAEAARGAHILLESAQDTLARFPALADTWREGDFGALVVLPLLAWGGLSEPSGSASPRTARSARAPGHSCTPWPNSAPRRSSALVSTRSSAARVSQPSRRFAPATPSSRWPATSCAIRSPASRATLNCSSGAASTTNGWSRPF